MNPKPLASRSMAGQFTRNYLLISVIPLLFLFFLIIGGTFIVRDHLADLITKSTYDLNTDAEKSLQKLGENIILSKSRAVAKQLEIYIQTHPNIDIKEMRKDPLFVELALQKVGKTGYTSLYEAGTWILRIHPNQQLIDKNINFLAKDLPSWWTVIEATRAGDEVSGYYDWRNPDGSVHKKYMTITPAKVRLNGKIMMVAATTYIDEFSAPVIDMKKKANKVAYSYQQYTSRTLLIMSVVFGLIIFLSFLGTYYLGRKAAFRYILPIMQLSKTTKELGEGKWDASAHKDVLHRQDEIGMLAHGFDLMSQQIKDTFSHLEQRVAQLKQAQDELKKSEENFRVLYEESQRDQEVYKSLIHSSADAILIYDLDDKVTYASPMFTRIFGWQPEEIIGQHIPFVPLAQKQERAAIIKDVMGNGTPRQNYETTRLTKDGRAIDVKLSASRYNDHAGHPAGMLVMFRDITAAKKLEEHLQQVERMEAIGTLAGGIAHDFNNLLMVIQGTISLLLYATQVSHPHYKHFITIEKQAQRGSKLTRQLLGYARKGKYEVKPLNLNEIVRESAETLCRTRKDIRFHYHLEPNLHSVEADVYQIEQVLMNLCINAADAMSNGGDLTLTTKNISARDIQNEIPEANSVNYTSLSVQDTGIGMDKKTMDRIFEPFFTTKSMDKGTGLGLASVYGIVKSHGGYIQVTSEPGRGATFTIYLPASDKSVASNPIPAQTSPKGSGTILIVDDEKPVLEVGADMLTAMGFDVIKAENGRKAIEIYRKEKDRIDLVILDMIMPDINGGEVFDLLKEINQNVAVLLSSGYSIEGKATEILERGCKGFIQKPFTMVEIAGKIKSIINRL